MLAEKARVRGFLSPSSSSPREEKSAKPSSIEISAPLAIGEISNSPSQALLPPTEIDSKDFASKKIRSASTDMVGGRSMMSSLGSWASGFSRSSRKSSTSETTTTTAPKDEKSVKKNFVQSLAKSITFPSPRLRLAGKQRGNTPAKYEITVEHREPNEDPVSPVEETPLTPEKPEPEAVTSLSESDKVETTVRISPTGPTVSASKSFTGRPYRGTLASTRAYGSADAKSGNKDEEDKVDETSSLMSKTEEEKKPSFSQSSSFSYIRPNTNFASVPSSRSLSFAKKPTLPPNKPMVFANKLSETTKVDEKSLSSSIKSPSDSKDSNITPATTSLSSFTRATPIIPIPLTTTTKSATLPAKSQLFSVPSTTSASKLSTVLTSTTTTTTPSVTTTTTSTTTAAKSVTTPSSFTNTATSKSPDTTDSKPDKTFLTPTSSSSMSSFKPEPTVKTSLTKTSTLPSSLSTAGDGPLKLPKSSTLPTVQAGRPLISRPILQAATSSAASLISKAPSTGVSQSSILSGNNKAERLTKDRTSRGVVFCDPITLPSPTNPNTPPIIHQPPTSGSTSPSSTTAEVTRGAIAPPTATTIKSQLPATTVITPTWSVVAPPKPDAVVCRIDDSDAGSEAPSSPEHSEPKSLSGLSKLKSKLMREGKKSKEPGSLSPTSSVKSLEAPPRPERGRLRSLDISGPILQSTVDSKMHLVPVCRSGDAEPLPAIPEVSTSAHPTPLKETGTKVKAKAPPPPVDVKPISSLKEEAKPSSSGSPVSWRSKDKRENEDKKPSSENINSSPTKSSRRPASIATTRPSRPTSRPPQPPPPRPLGGDHSSPKEPLYDTVRESSCEKEVVLEKAAPPLPPPRPKSLIGTSSKPKIEKFESPFTSPQEFVTPTSSPLFSRKSPDTVSTTSSSEGDLVRFR